MINFENQANKEIRIIQMSRYQTKNSTPDCLHPTQQYTETYCNPDGKFTRKHSFTIRAAKSRQAFRQQLEAMIPNTSVSTLFL
jgi:hypothetical protein